MSFVFVTSEREVSSFASGTYEQDVSGFTSAICEERDTARFASDTRYE